jgi:excisionase family DNA binding protein
VSPILLSVQDLAALLNISVRTVWRQDSSGQMPRPVRIGRTVRWFEEEILAWVRAGCPSRKVWEASGRNRRRA